MTFKPSLFGFLNFTESESPPLDYSTILANGFAFASDTLAGYPDNLSPWNVFDGGEPDPDLNWGWMSEENLDNLDGTWNQTTANYPHPKYLGFAYNGYKRPISSYTVSINPDYPNNYWMASWRLEGSDNTTTGLDGDWVHLQEDSWTPQFSPFTYTYEQIHTAGFPEDDTYFNPSLEPTMPISSGTNTYTLSETVSYKAYRLYINCGVPSEHSEYIEDEFIHIPDRWDGRIIYSPQVAVQHLTFNSP